MSGPARPEVPIIKQQRRESFDCGEPALNDFPRRHARRNHELGGAQAFVAVDPEEGQTFCADARSRKT
jgi:hypothetical protein